LPSADPYAAIPRHGPTCICRPCRNLRKRADWEAYRRRKPPVERCSSDEAAAHIAMLRRLGWKQQEIARAAGLSDATISTAKLPGWVINAETSDKILAVAPTQSRRG
jgi:hypothetical protein